MFAPLDHIVILSPDLPPASGPQGALEPGLDGATDSRSYAANRRKRGGLGPPVFVEIYFWREPQG